MLHILIIGKRPINQQRWNDILLIEILLNKKYEGINFLAIWADAH